ncbi:MAG TPA: hypothetical protein VL461_04425 [Dictyobacter sp.]|nr:hypothetical protein [Dictyobacter sp.]
MGVERAVTRWYLYRQSLLNEIARLEEQIAQQADKESSGTELSASAESASAANSEDLRQVLARTQEKLKNLGPCPRPMMG